MKIEVKPDGPGARPNRLVGYAAVFDSESSVLSEWEFRNGEPFTEIIKPGSFAKTLRENPDILAVYNHDKGAVLGRTANKSLRLWEDSTGLAFEDDLPDTSSARDVKAMVSNGYITGCSFCGYVTESSIEHRKGRPLLRVVTEIRLVEVTLGTACPAYGDTEIDLRSLRSGGLPMRAGTPRLDLARRRLKVLDLG